MHKGIAYITAIKNEFKANQSYISVLDLQPMQVTYASYICRSSNIENSGKYQLINALYERIKYTLIYNFLEKLLVIFSKSCLTLIIFNLSYSLFSLYFYFTTESKKSWIFSALLYNTPIIKG